MVYELYIKTKKENYCTYMRRGFIGGVSDVKVIGGSN